MENHWTLADRASTIDYKSQQIDLFVEALEKQGLAGTNDALILKTPENSFDENFKTLKSLQTRLTEIKTMDPRSFEYQTAIQQITAQEQGEAKQMLDVLQGCWYKQHHFLIWGVIGGINWIAMFVFVGVTGFIFWAEMADYN